MNTDANHEAIQRVLALKRYEQPPPGDFHDFSASVMTRLQTDRPSETAWWQRLGQLFDFTPAVVCGSAVAVCALVVASIATSFQLNAAPNVALQPLPEPPQVVFATQNNPPPLPPGFTAAPKSSMGPVLAASSFATPYGQDEYTCSFGN